MKKQFLIAACLAVLSLSAAQPGARTDTPDFDKMFDGVDFEKLLKDVETALEKAEKEQPGGIPKPLERPGKPAVKPAFFAPTATAATAPRKPMTKKDERMLLLDPNILTIPVAPNQTMTIPADESFYAYRDIMDRFVANLTALGQKVAEIKAFSPAFKETFATYCQSIIETIIIAHERVESKKIYTKLLLATPESNKPMVMAMKQLRQLILDAHDAVQRLNNKLVISAKEEEQESSIGTLREMAEKSKAVQPIEKAIPTKAKPHQRQQPLPVLEK